MSEKQSQEYNGNGEHKWENVTKTGETARLRVPGGWLYNMTIVPKGEAHLMNTVFVPMPEVVKHKV